MEPLPPSRLSWWGRENSLSLEQIRALALETGVSEKDIRMIIDMVGTDKSSIVHETRYLKQTR